MAEETGAAEALSELVRRTDAILALVKRTDVGGERGDMAAAAMFGAYVHAQRRLAVIRDVAARGAGRETHILSRSLLLMVARAVWVDQPVDRETREARFRSWLKRELEDETRWFDAMLEGGAELEAPEDRAARQEQLTGLSAAAKMPSDRQLLVDELGLGGYYWHLYVPASGHAHFSLRSAIDEVRAAAAAGEELPFDRPEPELAVEALGFSLIVYGLLIDMSEQTVRHGLREQVLEQVVIALTLSAKARGLDMPDPWQS